jgi:multiple sugar transport system permease protein
MTSLERRTARAAYWFLAPALSLIGVFFFLPIVASVVLSLTDFDIYAVASRHNLRWVGLANYHRLLQAPLFWKAFTNTLYFVVIAAPLSIGASLGAALLITSRLKPRGTAVFRTVFFLPVVTTLVAVAVVWRYIYHPRLGLLNYGLAAFGIGPIDWLGDPHWAMPAIILLAVWKNFGFNMVIFIAGLQSIPERLYEAASVDGAGPWPQFRSITLPALAPTFAFVAVMTLVGYLQLFAEPYVMTDGGPSNSTLSIVLLMYREGFRWWNMGTAAAIAFVLFAIIFVLTMAAMRLRREVPDAVAKEPSQ